MNTAVLPEARPNATADPLSRPPLATQDVQRYVWEGRFGSILIEVVHGRIFVNGKPVEPAAPEATA